VDIDPLRVERLGTPKNVVRRDGPKHICTNNIALSKKYTVKNNIFGV
jgi:hypothetical protein